MQSWGLTLPQHFLPCPHYSVCAESEVWYTNVLSKNMSNYSNYFAEKAEETDGQFLPLPIIPAGKEEQILSNIEVEPSTKNEVMYCWRSAVTESFNFKLHCYCIILVVQ